jgi:two-component system CheB/CheR fusion protein
MAFIIVSHIHPTANSQLAQILSRVTKMPVTLASSAKPIEANHVYVIPANADLFVERGAFRIVTPRRSRNNQVDLFLTSLGDAMGEHAIGILFSGYDADGTAGCGHIKAKGGITFAQDESAQVNVMPVSAQTSGFIDFVLPPEKIAQALGRIGKRLSRGESQAKSPLLRVKSQILKSRVKSR